jgi:hypothetical protein
MRCRWHTCQQSSQPALSPWPAGLRLLEVPGRLDGLIGRVVGRIVGDKVNHVVIRCTQG